MIPEQDVARLADGLPNHTLLILDGAYAEFVDGFDGHASLVDDRDNVFMTRTFSKIYGLGGLRLGWGYGPADIVNTLHRIRGPFNVNARSRKFVYLHPLLDRSDRLLPDDIFCSDCTIFLHMILFFYINPSMVCCYNVHC